MLHSRRLGCLRQSVLLQGGAVPNGLVRCQFRQPEVALPQAASVVPATRQAYLRSLGNQILNAILAAGLLVPGMGARLQPYGMSGRWCSYLEPPRSP